jgi:hypothetical protein
MSIIEVWWCRGDNKTGGGKEAKISAKLTAKFWQNLLIIVTDIGMIVSILRPYWKGVVNQFDMIFRLNRLYQNCLREHK